MLRCFLFDPPVAALLELERQLASARLDDAAAEQDVDYFLTGMNVTFLYSSCDYTSDCPDPSTPGLNMTSDELNVFKHVEEYAINDYCGCNLSSATDVIRGNTGADRENVVVLVAA